MQHFEATARKGAGTIVFGALLMAGFIFFLIGRNYLSQSKVQQFAVANLSHDVEKRAIAVSYFFSERMNDVQDLTGSVELAAFFENKALGMTMEYGLKASLSIVQESFHRFMERRRLGEERIYSRIVFLNESGQLLVDTSQRVCGIPVEGSVSIGRLSRSESASIAVQSVDATPHVVIAMPCRFKGDCVGQIVAWLELQTVYDRLVCQSNIALGRVDCLTYGSGQATVLVEPRQTDESEVLLAQLLNMDQAPRGVAGASTARYMKDGSGNDWVAVSDSVGETPFRLMSAWRASEVLGSTRPWHLLAALGTLAVLLLSILAVIWKSSVRTMRLQLSLQETAERERAIQGKNLELEREISERERVGTALRESEARYRELFEEIKRHESELRHARDAANAANRAKSEFLANMSHELHTPLNVIIGFTQLILEGETGELTAYQKEYLGDVLQSARNLLALIDEILDMTKVEAGALELNVNEVSLHHLLNRSIGMLKEKALKHGIRMSLEIGDIPQTIMADERKLKQILYNILANAVKFTPDGGEVRMIGDSADGCIRVTVTDTGIGLNREELGRIFEPFEQAQSGLARKYDGSGLGLALTKSLVELHSGRIFAESEGIGKGATFSFLIPVGPPLTKEDQAWDDLEDSADR